MYVCMYVCVYIYTQILVDKRMDTRMLTSFENSSIKHALPKNMSRILFLPQSAVLTQAVAHYFLPGEQVRLRPRLLLRFVSQHILLIILVLLILILLAVLLLHYHY